MSDYFMCKVVCFQSGYQSESFRCGGGLIKTLPATGGETGEEKRGTGAGRGKLGKGGGVRGKLSQR